MKVFNYQGTVSEDEWEIIGFYRVFVFRLREEPKITLSFPSKYKVHENAVTREDTDTEVMSVPFSTLPKESDVISLFDAFGAETEPIETSAAEQTQARGMKPISDTKGRGVWTIVNEPAAAKSAAVAPPVTPMIIRRSSAETSQSQPQTAAGKETKEEEEEQAEEAPQFMSAGTSFDAEDEQEEDETPELGSFGTDFS